MKEGHQDYEEIIELSAHLERSEEEVAMTAFSLLEKRPTLWREMTFSPQDNRLFFTEEEFKKFRPFQVPDIQKTDLTSGILDMFLLCLLWLKFLNTNIE